MKRVKNSDIKFKINKKLVYLPNFVIRFYTVNQKEYFFEKTQDDLVEYEREATVDDVEVILSGGTTVTEYYLPLNWSELLFVGQGILNYKLTNNIEDPEFPDYQYNKEEVVTTDFYIDSIKVDPEPEESLIERVIQLEEHLAEEIVNREEADAAISGAVDSEIARAISAETALQEAIDDEIERAISAETAIVDALEAEADRAISAETALDTKIDQEIADRIADVNAEEARAISAETALDAKIDAETNRATSAETALQTAINDEATARANADTALQTAITNEESRAREAESAITNALNAEVTRATGAENALDTKIDAETTRATGAEAALDAKIDTVSGNVITEEARAKGVEDVLSGAIDTLDVRFFDDAKYEDSGNTKVINFYNGNVVKATIDCTDFLVDGMIDDVRIENGYLVIDFNTASGKQDIRIPLTDIFNPANYYTKSETSGATEIANALALKLNISDFNTYSGNVATALEEKASQSTVDALNGVVTAHTADTSIHVTSSDKEKWNKVDDKADTTALTAVNDALTAHTADSVAHITAAERTAWNAKADSSAFTAHTADTTIHLTSGDVQSQISGKANSDDVYLKTETSGATEIATALSGKQATLVSSENIKTINNESILGSGNITIQSGGITSGEVQSMITSATTPIYQTIQENEEVTAAAFNVLNESLSGKQDTLIAGSNITISGNVISATGGGGGSSYTAGDGIDITNDVISVTGKVDTTTFNTYSGAVDTVINSKAAQSDLDALNGVVTAHTANTTVHVTASDKEKWNKVDDKADTTALTAVNDVLTAHTNDSTIHLTSGNVQTQIDNSISGKVNVSDNVVSAYTFDKSTKIEYLDAAAWQVPLIPDGTKKISIGFTMLPANNQLFETLQFVTFNPFGIVDVASGLTVGVSEDMSTFPITYTITSVTWTGDDSIMAYDLSENDTLLNLYALGEYQLAQAKPNGNNVFNVYIDVLEDIESGQTAEVVNDGVVKNFENIGKYLQNERNRVNNKLESKLDATAYTPVIIDSSLRQGSAHPVENGAIFDEVRVQTSSGGGETTLIFDENNETTNYPLGTTEFIVWADTTERFVNYTFYNDSTKLGNITVAYFDTVKVTQNKLPGATYTISGEFVTFTYQPLGITKIVRNRDGFVEKVINPPTYTSLKSVVNTKQNQLTPGTGISIQNDVISVTASSPSVDAYTKAESDAKFATITNFNSHSGDSTAHITSSERVYWNNKSNFSGNYSDLTNKPTIPIKTSQLENDSEYISYPAIKDMATKTWVSEQGYLTQHQDISGKQDVSGMTAYTQNSVFAAYTAATNSALASKQDTLTAGTGISIVNDVISVTATSPTVDAYTKAESDGKFATITNFNSHSGNTTAHITSAERTAWNAKSNFSGSYNDLTDKPTIPNYTAGSGITISNNVISAKIWSGTQAQYDALAVKDNDTIYLIYNS